GCAHLLSSILYGTHDILIAGAAADIAFETLANLGFSRIGIVFQQLIRGHNHTRGAEAALQAMLFPEAFLDGMQTTFVSQPFYSHHFRAISLYGKHRTSFYGLAVEQYITCSAL